MPPPNPPFGPPEGPEAAVEKTKSQQPLCPTPVGWSVGDECAIWTRFRQPTPLRPSRRRPQPVRGVAAPVAARFDARTRGGGAQRKPTAGRRRALLGACAEGACFRRARAPSEARREGVRGATPKGPPLTGLALLPPPSSFLLPPPHSENSSASSNQSQTPPPPPPPPLPITREHASAIHPCLETPRSRTEAKERESQPTLPKKQRT